MPVRTGIRSGKQPHPKQRELLWLVGLDPLHAPPGLIPCDEVLFGGQAGGAKSAGIRFLAMEMAQQWPTSKFGIFRRAGPDLDKTQVMPFLEEVPEGSGEFNWKQHEYTWNNGSVTRFHQCFEADDHLRYKSYEWHGLAFDESTEFSEDQLTFLRSRVRSPGYPGWHPIVVYATNPGSLSHEWHKLNFIEGHPESVPFWSASLGTMEDGRELRYRRCFLRSRLSDNPSLTPEQAMLGMAGISDPDIRRAMFEGDWDLHPGNFFSSFRRDLHVVNPFVIPNDWPCWRSVDWGYAAPAACLWLTRNPAVNYPEMYVYREWVARETPTQLQAAIIRELSADDPPIRLTLADPSMWRKTKGVGTSEAQEYAAGHIPLTMANNNRIQGWQKIHSLLYTAQDHRLQPGLRFFDTCQETIRQIANLQRSKIRPEDIKEPEADSDLRDDAGDALRYAIMGAKSASQSQDETRRHWQVRAHTPITRRADRFLRRPVAV